jgi:mycobactin peptide synthetase MbtE
MRREVLPEPPEDEPPEGEPPRGELEHLIVSVWTEVLNTEVSSRYDDFFLLGGSSMTAVHVSTELTKRLGFPVRPRVVYEYTELADLAERLTRLRPGAAEGRP